MSTIFTEKHLYAILDGGGDLSFLHGRLVMLRRSGFEYTTTLEWRTTNDPFKPHCLVRHAMSTNGLPSESLVWPLPTSGRIGGGLGDAPFEIDLLDDVPVEKTRTDEVEMDDETPLRVSLFETLGGLESWSDEYGVVSGRITSTRDLPDIVDSIRIGSHHVTIDLSTMNGQWLQIRDVEKVTEQFIDCGGRDVVFTIERSVGGSRYSTDVTFAHVDGSYHRTVATARQNLDPTDAAEAIFEKWATLMPRRR